MSEEEIKAIEYFKSNLEMTKEMTKEMGKRWGFQEEIKNNEIILNLIEKQEKVIDLMAEKLEEKSRWMTKGKWVLWAYNEVNRKVENDG